MQLFSTDLKKSVRHDDIQGKMFTCQNQILCIIYALIFKMRNTGRPPEHCKEMNTQVVWTRITFNRSRQNHIARHSERGKKRWQTEKEVGKQHQGMERPGVCQVPEGSGEQVKMEETGCGVIRGAQITPIVKG